MTGLAQGKPADIVFLDFSMVFDTVLGNTLTDKLLRSYMADRKVDENCLHSWVLTVLLSSARSS